MSSMQDQMFQQLFEQAKAAQQAGRLTEAKRLYLAAGKITLSAAQEASGAARELLVGRAKKLIQLSESLSAAQTSGGKGAPGGGAPSDPLPQEPLEELQKAMESQAAAAEDDGAEGLAYQSPLPARRRRRDRHA